MLSAKCSKSKRRGKCADICGKFVDMRGEKIYYVEAMNEFKDKKALFFDFDGTLWFGKYGEKLNLNRYMAVCAVLCVIVYMSLTKEDDGRSKAERKALKGGKK